MRNVYLALKRCVGIVLLLFCQAALAQPVINSFSPTSGKPGTTVTITGSGFSVMKDSNIVYFGPVRATVQSAAGNTLVVTVPVGATYAPITVTFNRLTGYSRVPFNVTFQNSNPTLDTNSFGSRKDVYGFNNPRLPTLADLNQDGRADVVLTNGIGSTLAVLKNTSVPGTVNFAAVKTFPVGPQPGPSAAGDFDGDGRLDIAVANGNSGLAASVSVLRNSSIGDTIKFDTTKNYATAFGTTSIVINDVDMDGKPDMLALCASTPSISIFRNTTTIIGNITFATKIDITTGFSPGDFSVTDIDGDGKPELVSISAGSNSYLSIWKNVSTPGTIAFDPKVDFPAAVIPYFVKVGDLNKDGRPDIIVANRINAGISVFRNESTLGSIAFAPRQDIATGANPLNITIADYNGDSWPDVAVGCDTPRAICIYPNLANDSIRLGARVAYNTGSQLSGVAAGDIDGDGETDLVFTNYVNGYAVSVLRNKQNGELPVITSFTPTSGGKGTEVTIFGKNLSTTNAVKFGGMLADSVLVWSDSVIKAKVDTGATGNVTVYTAYGVASKPGFTYIPDTTNIPDTTAPAIIGFSPTSAQKGTEVYIFGSGFTGTTAVRFGGINADSLIVLSDTLIVAIVDTGSTGSVSVQTPYGIASKPGFTYIPDTTNIPDTTAPAIIAFSPTSAQKGTEVYIFGSGFTGTTAVRFGGINADSLIVLSDTVIVAIVDTGSTGIVSVQTPYGIASKPGFTYIPDTTNIPDTTAPAIIAFSPTSAQKGTEVYIFGSGFTGTTAVRFGGINADSLIVLSDTVIVAIVDTGSTGSVSVQTPFGIASKPGFTFIADTTNIPDTTAPAILNFWPTSGQKGTAVYILGKNIHNATAVRFGGVLADSIVFLNDTTIRAIVDTGATGSVSVETPYGIASKPGFTFISDTTGNDTLFVNALMMTATGTAPTSFVLYPNPASKYVIWKQPVTSHRTRLLLVDMTGRIVKQIVVSSNTPQTTIPLNGLQPGVYKLVHTDGTKKFSRTLLIR